MLGTKAKSRQLFCFTLGTKCIILVVTIRKKTQIVYMYIHGAPMHAHLFVKLEFLIKNCTSVHTLDNDNIYVKASRVLWVFLIISVYEIARGITSVRLDL